MYSIPGGARVIHESELYIVLEFSEPIQIESADTIASEHGLMITSISYPAPDYFCVVNCVKIDEMYKISERRALTKMRMKANGGC